MTRNNDPWVLGISASHNGAVCLLRGDELVVAIQEERLSRRKRDRIFGAQHSQALDYCFNYAGIRPCDLSMVVLCVQGPVTDARHDLSRNPCLQIKEHSIPTLIIPHHLAHAASAFATSGFGDSAILVIDGAGSPSEDLSDEERKVIINPMEDNWEIISLYSGSDAVITPLEKHFSEYTERRDAPTPDRNCMPPFHSLGGMFAATAVQIFGEYMEAGKVMGLAPYGRPVYPPQDFFEIVDGRFVFSDKIPSLFRHDERWPAHQTEYEDLACSVQQALEVAVLYLVDRLHDLSPSSNLCYAGGVALNSIVNERIIRESKFKNVYIIPAAEDSGPAIGAAYLGLWQLGRANRRKKLLHDAVGRQYSMTAIRQAINETPGVEIVESENVVSDAAQLLADGKILGWFQGRSELGPRALGQRSILCDPRRPDGKATLNNRVKHREAFRPFAPAVLLEHARDWFELEGINPESAHMLRICTFKENKKELVPAVVHVDGTGRFQTITKEANGKFYDLIEAFYGRTGVPIILNTSFNVMGLPIVETPEDALMCLLSTGIDYCVLEDVMVKKRGHILLGLDLAPNYQPSQAEPNEKLNALPGKKSKRPLREYVGSYNSPVGTLLIDREKNQLIGAYNAQSALLVRLADDLFEPTGDHFKGVTLAFTPDSDGFIERAVIRVGESEETVFTRKAKPWSVSKSYLKKCVGEYEVAGRRLQVLLLEENRFLITGPGQPYYFLIPSQKGKFDLKNTPGYHLQFIVAENGKVTEAIISQPNGDFRLKRVSK